MKNKERNEYGEFDGLAKNLLSVPHNELKKKLDAERNAKKRKKSKVSSASREGDEKV